MGQHANEQPKLKRYCQRMPPLTRVKSPNFYRRQSSRDTGGLSKDVEQRNVCATSSLRRVILSPSFSDFFQGNGPIDMMEEDVISSFTILLKISLTIWDFVLPATPSVPAVIGVSICVH
ncbi:hypothetical protein HAX54_034675 [Datura stramonium]|uniref:Uncharacterized protein n=1 Tax=Datura stramonium TaxID=4076 RepID=A0ABS8VFG0_DATST|nr:hypothetical protein [Datura stramonium]